MHFTLVIVSPLKSPGRTGALDGESCLRVPEQDPTAGQENTPGVGVGALISLSL